MTMNYETKKRIESNKRTISDVICDLSNLIINNSSDTEIMECFKVINKLSSEAITLLSEIITEEKPKKVILCEVKKVSTKTASTNSDKKSDKIMWSDKSGFGYHVKSLGACKEFYIIDPINGHEESVDFGTFIKHIKNHHSDDIKI